MIPADVCGHRQGRGERQSAAHAHDSAEDVAIISIQHQGLHMSKAVQRDFHHLRRQPGIAEIREGSRRIDDPGPVKWIKLSRFN